MLTLLLNSAFSLMFKLSQHTAAKLLKWFTHNPAPSGHCEYFALPSISFVHSFMCVVTSKAEKQDYAAVLRSKMGIWPLQLQI